MPVIDKKTVIPLVEKWATNSSHFVWTIGDFNYFQATNGWVLAYTQIKNTLVLALEPLYPSDTPTNNLKKDLEIALDEIEELLKPKVLCFVGVYGSFLKIIHSLGFQSIQVGEEPWVDLSNCIPRGNAGKGVRSARNQAIKSGLTVDEWSEKDLESGSKKYTLLKEIQETWSGRRLLQLEGFLNSTDPFSNRTNRRYFVAISNNNRVESFLVASPVGSTSKVFLEDLISRGDAQKGSGELLTLEAMVRLEEAGFKEASLGVVSLAGIKSPKTYRLPSSVRSGFLKAATWIKRIYNFNGLEIFRKRFKPNHWESIYIAVKVSDNVNLAPEIGWLKALTSVVLCFRPKFNFGPSFIFIQISSILRKYPLTLSLIALNSVPFALVNHFGKLPDQVLSRFGFSASAPKFEWIYRTITSDFLYFDPSHFWSVCIPFLILLIWAERSQNRRFLISFMLLSTLLDDVANFLLIIKPFSFLSPKLFSRLIDIKDVGGSLGLISLLGLQITQFKKHRELSFVILVLMSVLGFVFAADHINGVILNLNHFLFLCIGFSVGKLRFEFLRNQSRKVAKQKPPEGKSVYSEPVKTERLKKSA